MVPDRRLTALLVLLGMSLLGCPVWGQGPEEEKKPVIKQPTLFELAKLYQELELPLPPRDAKFAKMAFDEFVDNRSEKKYQIYWFLKTENKTKLWNGLFQFFPDGYYRSNFIELVYEKPPKPDEILTILKLDRLTSPPNDAIENRPELVFAIQCHLLGHHEQARFFYWRCLKAATEPLDHTLIIAAWNYWVEQLTDPIRDRRPVFAKLQHLYQKYDILSSREKGSLNQRKGHDRILEQAKLTLEPSKAKPGSVEALIDALVDSRTKDPINLDSISPCDPWNRLEQIQFRKRRISGFDLRSDAEIRLAKLGFEAVPALIEHLDDQRLTRDRIQMNPWLNGMSDRTFSNEAFTTVGKKIRFILSTYFPFTLMRKNGNYNSRKIDYINFWQIINSNDEFTYLLRSLDLDKFEIPFFQSLYNRFPEKIPAFYKKIIDANLLHHNLANFVYFIVDSCIERKEKVDLLLMAAKHSHFSFQTDALRGLLEVDPKVCQEICLELISKLPMEVKKSDRDGPSPHLTLARLAFCLDDPKVGEILLSFVKNLPLGAKMAFLDKPFFYDYRPSKYFAVNFYESFLNDSNFFINNDEKYEFDFVFIRSEKIEVRNFAALKILEFLDIDISYDDNTPPHQWERIRKLAKNEVERRREEEKRK